MAKDIRWEVLPEAHGKLHGKAKVYFAHRKDSDTCYSAACPQPRTKPYSDKELTLQNKFGQASVITNQIMLDPDMLETYMENFGKQKRYKTLRGFIFAQEYQKLA